MPKKFNKILVVIPTYNEAKTIVNVLKKIKYDKLVVDNASTDNTVDITKKFAKIIRHEKNLGKAASLIEGYNYGVEKNYDVIITIDADGEHNPEQIPEFLEKIKKYDLVVGQRKLFRSSKRKLLNYWTNFWFNMFAPGISDIQCGYRTIRTDLLKKMNLNSKGFNIEMEVLLEAIKKEGKIGKVYIETKPKKYTNITVMDYIKMNNFFDIWILKNYKYLKINFFLKILLICSVLIGISLGNIIKIFIK